MEVEFAAVLSIVQCGLAADSFGFVQVHLIYLDEAGNTGKKADPSQPIHMIGSLIVEQSQVRPVELALEEIAEAFIENSKPPNVSAARFLEFHGSLIYSGKDQFKGVNPDDRIALCRSIIACCEKAGLRFGWCAVNKMKLLGGHPHMRCFQFTLERVQDYLTVKSDLGLIVADEHHELEEELIRDLALSKASSTGWGWRPTQIVNIIDTVHFVKSRHNRLVQACDVLTYLALKSYRIYDKLWTNYSADPLAHGPGYPWYKDKYLSQSEKIVVEMGSDIAQLEQFTKMWPV